MTTCMTSARRSHLNWAMDDCDRYGNTLRRMWHLNGHVLHHSQSHLSDADYEIVATQATVTHGLNWIAKQSTLFLCFKLQIQAWWAWHVTCQTTWTCRRRMIWRKEYRQVHRMSAATQLDGCLCLCSSELATLVIKVRQYIPFRNNVHVRYAYGKNAITFCRINDISCA